MRISKQTKPDELTVLGLYFIVNQPNNEQNVHVIPVQLTRARTILRRDETLTITVDANELLDEIREQR